MGKRKNPHAPNTPEWYKHEMRTVPISSAEELELLLQHSGNNSEQNDGIHKDNSGLLIAVWYQCGFCKMRIEPFNESIMKVLNNSDPGGVHEDHFVSWLDAVDIGKKEQDNQAVFKILKKYGVPGLRMDRIGFPMMFRIKNGKVEDYRFFSEEDNNADSILSFLNKSRRT